VSYFWRNGHLDAVASHRRWHTLIVGVSFWPLDIQHVTDGSGDAFTRWLTTSVFHNVNGSATYTNFYYAKSTAGGTTSLTLNFSGGSTYLLVAVVEVGPDSIPPRRWINPASTNPSRHTAAWSSATVTTTAASEYLFFLGGHRRRESFLFESGQRLDHREPDQ